MSQPWQSSVTDDWWTPVEFFNELDREFKFTLDAAADSKNALCDRYFNRRQNGLKQSWKGETVWLNPPYGREIKDWIRKAHDEAKAGATVVCLIPARTETSYWHGYIFGVAEVRFVKGRIKFSGPYEGPGHNAPFASAVVIFRPPGSKQGRRQTA